MVVGRAGIGLDNVDVAAATKRGVMVVNAPQTNIVSAAEHTMALLLAQARNVPQAHAALVAGRWERSKWEGVELADKTLGIVGLGRIGKLVADRAKGFGMRLVAYDPFVSAERGRQMGVELLAARPGRRRVRLPHDPPAEDARDDRASSTATCCSRPSRRCASINVARGGIVDEADARRRHPRRHRSPAPRSTCSRPSRRPSRRCSSSTSVVVTPHLGASTREAQDKAGDTIADDGRSWRSPATSCRSPSTSTAAEANETIRPFLPLAERLGRLFVSLVGALPDGARDLRRGRDRRLRHPHPRPRRC